MAETSTEPLDVIVVGAGLAGLNAARCLQQAGRSVLVLEARGEVGDRTRTRLLEGEVADFGGEWVGWAHRRIRALVGEFGLTIEPARNAGSPILWRLPSGERYGRLPPARMWWDLVRVFDAAGRRARGIRPAAPRDAASARELDAVSLAEWFDEFAVGGDARYVLERLIGSLASSELSRLSLLHFLWWMRMAGGPLRSVHATFQSRISQGAQELSRRIAAQLHDRVRVDHPVRRVTQPDGVAVEVASGETYEARLAIVAVPVPRVVSIELDPVLPEDQRELSHLRIGGGVKIVALLPPGHRVRHNMVIGGECVWGAYRRGARVTGFAPPPDADRPDDELLSDLAAAFGVEPHELRSPTVFRWGSEAYIPGCNAAFAPGEVCRYGPALRRPHGNIHFAGAERSSWPNNMEGALESGEQAARGAIDTLLR